jgi:hypothetical protein
LPKGYHGLGLRQVETVLHRQVEVEAEVEEAVAHQEHPCWAAEEEPEVEQVVLLKVAVVEVVQLLYRANMKMVVVVEEEEVVEVEEWHPYHAKMAEVVVEGHHLCRKQKPDEVEEVEVHMCDPVP